MKGGERMEIKGLGNSFLPLSQGKATQSNDPSFQKVLNQAVNKNNNQTSNLSLDQKEIKDAKAILLFFKKTQTDKIDVEKQDAGKSSNLLQMVKGLLGIDDQKWSEMIAELENKTNVKLKDDDPLSLLMDGLSFLSMNPQVAGLSDNMILFLKTAKVYSSLSNQDGAGQPFLTELLNTVQEHLEDFIQKGQVQTKRTYLENTFSQFVSEMKEQTVGTSQTGRLKVIDRLTDWNANTSFLQQMSKPEQMAVMNGSAKSVSVNDLIQQFESILSKSQFSKMGGVQKLFIKLNPEHLGSISIELYRREQSLTARILTTTEAAKEALESHVHNLKDAFEAQNIKVDHVEIGQQEGQQENYFNGGQNNQQEYPQEQGPETDDQDEPAGSFILTLEEAILNQEA